MFLGMFKFLSKPLRRDAVITGANFTNQYGEIAWVKIDGIENRRWEGAIADMVSRGWKFTGVTTTKGDVPASTRLGYRARAAYLRA
jgi:hypothetical protein